MLGATKAIRKRLPVELLRTSRPAGWLIAAGLFRIGMLYGAARESAVTVALTVVLGFPFCLFLFGLNDLADAPSDDLNSRKGGWLHGGRIAPELARPVRWAVVAAGVVVLGLAPLLPLRAGLVLAAVLGVAALYSWPLGPLPRLKEIPIVDGLASSAIIGGLLATGYAIGAPLEGVGAEPFAFVPAMVSLHVFASVMDVESDRAADHRTLPVRIGARGASLVALGLSLVTVATIPALDFARAIAACAVAQAAAMAMSIALPSWVTPRRAFVAIGIASAAGMAHLLLFEL